jgi:hypothetical protein
MISVFSWTKDHESFGIFDASQLKIFLKGSNMAHRGLYAPTGAEKSLNLLAFCG